MLNVFNEETTPFSFQSFKIAFQYIRGTMEGNDSRVSTISAKIC